MKHDMIIGKTFQSKAGGALCEIIDAENCRRIKIKWLDDFGHIATVYATALREGSVKNPFEPSVYGVGYVGVGRFRAWVNGEVTKEYKTWAHMLERCYNPKVGSYARYGGRGVRVSECWLNFQDFAGWITSQPFWGQSGFHLDKDILGDSMLYSADNCCYVPQEINTTMKTSFEKKALNIAMDLRGGSVRWQVVANMGGKTRHVGMYGNQEDADKASVAAKIEVVSALAAQYMHVLTRDVYEKLINWKPAFLHDQAA